MVRTWDEEQLRADGFGRVHAEIDWYDGPRVGLVDIGGRPLYFDGYGQYHGGDELDVYRVWPASAVAALVCAATAATVLLAGDALTLAARRRGHGHRA